MTESKPQLPGANRVAWRIFLIQQLNAVYSLPCLLYFFIQIAQVPKAQMGLALSGVPLLVVLWGMAVPLGAVQWLTRRALAHHAAEPPGARLARILRLPRALEFAFLASYMTGNGMYLVWITSRLGKPTYIAIWDAGINLIMLMVVMVWTRISIERTLMPYAVEEHLQSPHVTLGGGGLLWPRQSWYLPYSFAVFILCTIITMASVVAQSGLSLYQELAGSLTPEAMAVLDQKLPAVVDRTSLPVALLGLFMLLSSAISAFLLTRQQAQGFHAIQSSIEGLANGAPQPPSWVTTDELGDLARAIGRAFDKLRQFSGSLARTAHTLGGSADWLHQSNLSQSKALSRQAAALQEAQVTAQEIQQTSQVTAQKATGMLEQAGNFEEVGRKGETAIQASLQSLQEIRTQVEQMTASIRALGERTQQIDSIARVVKDLADRSNMLAINAAIEAVRAGEMGKGFGIVAREMRTLADQSAKATNNVRDMLGELAESARSTVSMIEAGVEKVASSLEQLKGSGDNMRALSGMVRDNVAVVRQISATVNQQDVGIQQIFQAIRDLNQIMSETLGQVGQTGQVTEEVRGVAGEVKQLVTEYGWERSVVGQGTRPQPAPQGASAPVR
jgi:methyl-accepting chemotaxis protein